MKSSGSKIMCVVPSRAYVEAESPQQIEEKFRDIEIVSETPAWMNAELQSKLST